ncbi:MAG: hypothetical protein V4710_20930, partial [Verrucomicrobiota bacterium]
SFPGFLAQKRLDLPMDARFKTAINHQALENRDGMLDHFASSKGERPVVEPKQKNPALPANKRLQESDVRMYS